MSYIDQIKPAALSAAKSEPVTEQLEAVSMRVTEAAALTATIDHCVFSDVLERANASGDRKFVEDADRLICLLPILKRELSGISDDVGDIAAQVRTAQGGADNAEWTAALNYYRLTENADTSGMDERHADMAGDVAANALNALVAVRAGSAAMMLEKMRIIAQTDTVGADGYFAQLLLDAEALAGNLIAKEA